MKPSPSSRLLIAALALCGGLASAEKADRSKPMHVEADALRYDDLKQTSVFTGRAVLSKGTILIRGARIEVRQDGEGNQFGMVSAEPGKRAFFRQKREGLDEFIEGEGETIEYDSKADTVKLIKTAQLRRYRGATLNDDFTGTVIFYNNTTNVFTIDGAATQGSPSTPTGRVRAMLTPKPEVAAAAPAGDVLPAPAPTPVLRPATTLGQEKK